MLPCKKLVTNETVTETGQVTEIYSKYFVKALYSHR